jgi:hypothetical protein
MLHNATYNINDALIPIGGSMWVRLVEACYYGRRSAHGIP